MNEINMKAMQTQINNAKNELRNEMKTLIQALMSNQTSEGKPCKRCDNETEFKNYEMDQFCRIKRIKREFNDARTSQQIGVAERKNRTRIETVRTIYYNTLDHLGKFDGKANEGFLVGYFINSKAFRVYNSRTKKVEENLHVNFLENQPNVVGSGPEWLFDIDSLTNSMNYQPVSARNRTNSIAGSKIHSDVGQEGKEKVFDQEYILLPVLNTSSCSFNPTVKTACDKDRTFQRTYGEWNFSTPIAVNAAGSSFSHPAALDDFSNMSNLEDTGIFDDAYDDRDEMEPKKVTQALDDESWVEVMQEELLQFKLLNVWTLVDLPHGKRAIRSKWVYRNKRDQRGIVVRNKSRLVAQGHRQEEGIDYDEFFDHIARIEAIRLFLAYASFMDFTVYQMNVKSAFLYGTIKEEVYVSQPPGFVDLEFSDRVYKVEKALYGLHQALRA
nr:retrovirus-related Pol polyprotein from transposon TNT 1-94 [Tanacetum cinerariifolium]